jgi:hypothetical protein
MFSVTTVFGYANGREIANNVEATQIAPHILSAGD